MIIAFLYVLGLKYEILTQVYHQPNVGKFAIDRRLSVANLLKGGGLK